MRKLLGIGVLLAAASAAHADSAGVMTDAFAKYADPNSVVAAVKTEFKAKPGQPVRITVYDSEDSFLELARLKHQGELNEEGVAVVSLLGLEPGEYSFAAYLDENGDGVLNRGGFLGRPKEPVAFSNGFRPKLRKPRFDETKVAVAPGSVVVITLED
ncbi:DUF2141 domain-containing protein [Hyphococcus flavus]|uniref:DUF2141 domain-containing protein n=1 Tax=Hyphococcus flavus TaxID=1866326 RepID=A0AAE9ZK50_9PROT|nr:DUF2141 domain-containing protein [Hyphococcus flavus]WDI32631.1 DUF2141 domain-containing protein [Hyphococcus flavus]